MAQTVRQMLARRESTVSVTPDTTVFDTLQHMADKDVGWALVIRGEELVGIFTERDYARKVALQGRSSRHIPVSDVMTTSVITIPPDVTAEQCLALMDDKQIRHLPVVENGRVMGVVSIRDAVKVVVAEHQFTIDALVHYIKGGA